jgi:DNA-binding transcriptional LysR family regulator
MSGDPRAEVDLAEGERPRVALIPEPERDPEPDYRDAAIEFRHLRYFATVAEELHFGRAAARLFISQPALSQTILRLERALGVRLLTRSRQSVELTDAGAELLSHARRLLADKNAAVGRVRSVDRGEAGVLHVGVAMLAAAEIAPVLTAAREAYPDLVLERSAALSERLLDQLHDGGLDVAFVHQVPSLATLENVDWEVVRRGRLALLVSKERPLAQRSSVALSELRDETFLANPRELAPSAYQGMKLMCRQFGGFDPNLIESAATSTLPMDSDWGPIVDGSAITVMPEGTAEAVRPPELAVVPIEPPPQFIVAMAWHQRHSSLVLGRVLDFVRVYCAEHGWIGEPSPEAAPSLRLLHPRPGRC